MAGAYRLGPQSGRLLVHTTRTGLGAKAGHDVTIEVTRWHGRATVDTADPANSSVTVEVAVDTFEVREATGGVKPLTEADRAEINKTLGEVLHTAQHPTMIMGVTRPVTVQGRVTDGRVVGRAAVVQSQWGIRPYSAFFGALKLRDEVKVDFDAAPTPDG